MPDNKKIGFTFRVLEKRVKTLEDKTKALENDGELEKKKNSMKSLANFQGILKTLEKQLNAIKIADTGMKTDTGPVKHARQLSDEAVKCINSDDQNGLKKVVPELESAIQDIKDANSRVIEAPPEKAYFETPAKPFFQSFGGERTKDDEKNALIDCQNRIAYQQSLLSKLPKPLPAFRYEVRLLSIIGYMLLSNTKLSPARLQSMDPLVFYPLGIYFMDFLAGVKTELPPYVMTEILNQFILQEETKRDFNYKDAQSVIFLKNYLDFRRKQKEINKANVITAITPNLEHFGFFGFINDCRLIAQALNLCYGVKYANLDKVVISDVIQTANEYGHKVFRALNENRLKYTPHQKPSMQMTR